jgi:hypothetical protein
VHAIHSGSPEEDCPATENEYRSRWRYRKHSHINPAHNRPATKKRRRYNRGFRTVAFLPVALAPRSTALTRVLDAKPFDIRCGGAATNTMPTE